MTPGAGFFVLGYGHISYIVKMHYFLKYFLIISQAKIKQTKYIVMMTKEGYTKIVNVMIPGTGVFMLGCGHISHIVKMHYFFKNLLFNSQALIRQTKYVVMMTKEGSIKIVNFQTCRAGVLIIGRGHISSENEFCLLKSFLYSPRY